GDVDRARELLTRHADVARSENLHFVAGWHSLDASVLGMEGRPKEALAAAEQALEVHREAGGSHYHIAFCALDAAASVGGDEVRELHGRFDELNAVQLTPSIRALRARLRARLPEYDAEREFATAERLFGELGAPFHLAVVQLEHAEWLVEQGRSGEAEPLLA